jgi:hypothetical protein
VSPVFLVPESTVDKQGAGEGFPVGAGEALVTLGIVAVEEQESLHVSLWQSEDGQNWEAKPFAQFSQKFYVGTQSLLVRLEAGYVQARWRVNRWGRGDLTPLFTFYVFIEPLR